MVHTWFHLFNIILIVIKVVLLVVIVIIIITSVIMMKSVISTEHTELSGLGIPEFNPFMDVGTSKVHLLVWLSQTRPPICFLDWQVMILYIYFSILLAGNLIIRFRHILYIIFMLYINVIIIYMSIHVFILVITI